MTLYSQLTEKANEILVISFSHMGVPAGTFAHPNALKEFPYSILHINCPNNSFYLAEVPGVGKDVSEIAQFLKARITEIAPRKAVCFGTSMGAFGALLYGFLIGADLIVSLGPEIPLGLKGAPAKNITQDPSIFTHPLGKDVLSIVKPGKTRLVALFGEKAIADIFGALALNDCLVDSCFSIKNAYHSLAPFIEGVWGLNRFLTEAVETDLPTGFIAEHGGDFIQYRELAERLYTLTHCGGTETGFRDLLNSLSETVSAVSQSYAYLAGARYFLENGRTAEGLPLLRQAFSRNPHDPEAATLYFEADPGEFMSLGRSAEYFMWLLRTYRFNKNATYYRLAALMFHHLAPAFASIEETLAPFLVHEKHWAEFAFHLGNLLLNEGDFRGAEEQLQRAVTLSPNNPTFERVLSRTRQEAGARQQEVARSKAA